MRLSDINEFVDAYKLANRLHERAFGSGFYSPSVQLPSASALREAATLCDRSIASTSYDDGEGRRLSFDFRGIVFEFWGRE